MNGLMTRSGLLLSFVIILFTACEKEDRECTGIVQQQYNYTDFKRIKAGHNLQLTIKKGTGFSVTAEGCVNEI